jgi:hypothetical protein
MDAEGLAKAALSAIDDLLDDEIVGFFAGGVLVPSKIGTWQSLF